MSDKKNKKTAMCTHECEPEESGRSAQAKAKTRRRVRTALMSTVIALSASAIAALSVALYYSETRNATQESYIRSMEAVYSRSYYDLLDSANDLDLRLAKLRAASTAEAQRDLLYGVWQTATSASASLAAFEGGTEGIMKANKFLGQVGDYARCLAEEMGDGEPLTAEEAQTLGKMREVAAAFKNALSGTRKAMMEGRIFTGSNGLIDGFAASFDEFAEPSFEYPQMIYDGPFSDSLDDRDCKALEGLDNIDKTLGAELLADYIPEARDIAYYDRTEGDIVTLNYSFAVDGGSGFAQLSEKGGLLVACNVDYGVAATENGYPQHCAAALKFAENAGYDDMRVVWCSLSQGTVYVNLAPVQNGVVLYPDLIKVKVDETRGVVTGLDAAHYVFNHTERALPAPVVSVGEASTKVVLPAVSGAQLCLIPLEETKEVLAYEFECESGGTYYVYIDAMTGEEADILYVIDSDQGRVTA